MLLFLGSIEEKHILSRLSGGAHGRAPPFVATSPTARIVCVPARAAVASLVVEVHRTFWTRTLLDTTVVASGQLVDAKRRQSSDRILSKHDLFGRHRRREEFYALCGAFGTIDDGEVRGLRFDA
jgi:hypothetical protein